MFSRTDIYSDQKCNLYLSSDIQQGVIIIIKDFIIVQGRRHVYSRSSLLRAFYITDGLLRRTLSPSCEADEKQHRSRARYFGHILSIFKFEVYNSSQIKLKSIWNFSSSSGGGIVVEFKRQLNRVLNSFLHLNDYLKNSFAHE